MRAVLDTNVLISATFWTGGPKQLLNRGRRKEFILLTSHLLLSELRAVLTREDKPFRLSTVEADTVIRAIQDITLIVQPHSHLSVCRDESDNRVLECAVDGQADCIVSGDIHLLELQTFQGVDILTVKDFLNRIETIL